MFASLGSQAIFAESRIIAPHYRGRDETDRIAGEIKATHLDFRYQPIAEGEEAGNGGRVRKASGRPDEASAYGGTDFVMPLTAGLRPIIFFDKLP